MIVREDLQRLRDIERLMGEIMEHITISDSDYEFFRNTIYPIGGYIRAYEKLYERSE